MYTPNSGPSTNPRFDATAIMHIHQSRSWLLYISSRLPVNTLAGIEETNPVTHRPMTTAARDGTAGMMIHPMLKMAVLRTYNRFRPNVSE